MPFLWAAHPQFAVTERTRILLPDSVKEMLCVFGGSRFETGSAYETGEFRDLQPQTSGDGRKFYVPGAVDFGVSGLLGTESGSYLLILVQPEDVPHYGVWIDEGMFNDRAACALEPGIGYYDSLERAAANGTAGVLEAAGSRTWFVDLELGQGEWTADSAIAGTVSLSGFAGTATANGPSSV